ncbi:MAG: hypothetical protein M3229_04330 [Actinomycetota bacterium]|nr:hypothetical protein [Actinomycetota bacterium]
MAAAAATFALAASPAFAHFCSKSGWSDAALAHASKSQAWLTGAEWKAFADEAVEDGFVSPAGADQLKGQIDAMPADTLFKGPGLLAGGTLKKGNTPAHFSYLDFEAAEAACA